MNLKKISHWCWIFLLLGWILTGCEKPADPIRVGDMAPPFTVTLLTGEVRTLESYRGKGLVITFISSWCPCSNDSLPLFKAAHEQHKGKVAFLMVGIQDAESTFKAFVQKHDIPYDAAFDATKLGRTYGINAPPTTVFIDKTGKVNQFFYGNIKDKSSEFARWVEELSL